LLSKIVRGGGKVKSLHFDQITHVPRPVEELKEDDFPEQPGEEAMLLDAQAKARSIIEEAERAAHQIEQEAYQRGYQEGLNFAKIETAEIIETISSIAEEAIEEKWKVIRTVEDTVVDLALEIADKIIAEQVKLDPEIVVGVAKKALLVATEREHIQIRVNPEDLESIKAAKEDLMASMDGIEKIEVIADRRIRKGGCVFETVAGNVDARIQSQLSEASQALKGVVSID